MKPYRVVVDTTARSLGSPDTAVIRNAGATACYLGATGVTGSTGFELPAGDAITISDNDSELFAITASSSTTIHILAGS